MKNYKQFLEEVDLRGNKGVPSDFMSNAELDATRNLNVSIDQMGNPMLMMDLSNKSTKFITTVGLDPNSADYNEKLEERYKKLEDIALNVIQDEYGDILEASEKPVELIIKLVRPGSISEELPELGNKTQDSTNKPEYSQEETQEETETQDEEESQEEDDFFSFFDDEDQEEESQEEEEEIVSNKDVSNAIDKKKILNMLTQGEGKSTKDIIKFSEVVEKGLQEIFGDKSKEILSLWSKLSDEADKNDWRIPVNMKADMMVSAPQGLAGAVDLKWESLNNKFYSLKLLKENTDFSKIVIRAYGIDFPMLIHEAVKGIYLLLQSGAIKKDEELAREIKNATTSYKDEAEDFRYGTLAQSMFRDFINKCVGSTKYKNMKEKVFAQLSLDKGRGGKFSDEEFLEITKSLFSVFDKVNEGKVKFVIDSEKFNQSIAYIKIQKLVDELNEIEDEYQQSLRDYDMEKRFNKPSNEDEFADDKQSQSEIDRLIRQTAEKEEDLTLLSPSELQSLIDDALDSGDYAEVKRLSAFLKEGKEIYLNEMKRFNRNKNK